jgi:hypothetical protein
VPLVLGVPHERQVRVEDEREITGCHARSCFAPERRRVKLRAV